MAREYIENVSYGFYGARMDGVQRMQRLYAGGFKDAALLVLAYATMMGESGGYLKAFHHNTQRNEDETIKRYYWNGEAYSTEASSSVDGFEYMKVLSTDLGFIQKNTAHSPAVYVRMIENESLAFVDGLFEDNPDLADGWLSCAIAWAMYNAPGPGGAPRQFTPWYAFLNGGYKKGLPNASVQVGRFMAHKFIANKDYVIANPKFLED